MTHICSSLDDGGFSFFVEMQLRSLNNHKWLWHCGAISLTVSTDNHHESCYDSSVCVAHAQKYTNAAFPNDNPFLSLLPTHFHPEIPVVCSIPLFHPLCLSSLSFSLLLPVYFLSSYFLSSPLSLTGPTVKGVYHPLRVATCLCLRPAVLSSYHLLVMRLVLLRTQKTSIPPPNNVFRWLS